MADPIDPHTDTLPSGRPVPLRPMQPAPPLTVHIVDGPMWTLADRHPERFTMVVFYRGYHCPVCRTYLQELERTLGDFTDRGVEVIAISGDDRERAAASKREWGLGRLTLGYAQPVASMREWGLFISRGNNPKEPAEFGEPGLFLIRPDGTLYYIALNSMPFGRPTIGDMLRAVDFIIARDYSARGEA